MRDRRWTLAVQLCSPYNSDCKSHIAYIQLHLLPPQSAHSAAGCAKHKQAKRNDAKRREEDEREAEEESSREAKCQMYRKGSQKWRIRIVVVMMMHDLVKI